MRIASGLPSFPARSGCTAWNARIGHGDFRSAMRNRKLGRCACRLERDLRRFQHQRNEFHTLPNDRTFPILTDFNPKNIAKRACVAQVATISHIGARSTRHPPPSCSFPSLWTSTRPPRTKHQRRKRPPAVSLMHTLRDLCHQVWCVVMSYRTSCATAIARLR